MMLKPAKPRVKYILVSWIDLTASADHQYREGNYRSDVIPDLLRGLRDRGVREIEIDHRSMSTEDALAKYL